MGESVRRAGRSPWEILFEGGDDAAFIVPAGEFVGAVDQLLREFSRLAPGFTVSIGAVVAHSHFPIAELFRMSKDLQRSAKGVKGKHSIDYAIVTTSMTGRLMEERKGVAQRSGGLYRTAKPYAAEDFLELRSAIKELRDLGASASRVKGFWGTAHKGRMEAELEYLWTLSRLNGKVRPVVNKVMKGSFWGQLDDGRTVTRAADLAELWEFVR
jgi:hypothetical protein